MRIAQIAPLCEAVPPKLDGGTERVVSFLTEELVALGHDVTLFASGDSVTRAELHPGWPEALRLDPLIRDQLAPILLMLEAVRKRAHEFDVMHFHMGYLPFSLFSRQPTPFVTTLHGPLDLPELKQMFRAFPEVPVVSISDSQRRPLPDANYVATVYHGLPAGLLMPVDAIRPEYLAFLGRISPEKGPDAAIRIARACGIPLKIAAKVDQADRGYFEICHSADAGGWRRGDGRRNIRRRKAGFSVGCRRTADADRLAGTVRPRDDRSNGVRHAGDRLQSRLGARDHR